MSRILRTAVLVILGLFWLLPVYLLAGQREQVAR